MTRVSEQDPSNSREGGTQGLRSQLVNRQVAFLPACMTTSGRIHGEFLRLLFFLSNKQADDYFAALSYNAYPWGI